MKTQKLPPRQNPSESQPAGLALEDHDVIDPLSDSGASEIDQDFIDALEDSMSDGASKDQLKA
jgi:hypothetical protein